MKTSNNQVSIHWFRQDLRLLDNPVALKYLNIFKDKVTDNLVHKLNFIKI